MKKRIAIIAGIILVGITALFGWREYRIQQKNAERGEVMEKALRPLRVEEQSIQEELVEAERTYLKAKEGFGTISIIFTELDELVYTEIYTMMREYGFPGMLMLSETQFPGMEGCISLEQFNELIQGGWTTCIQWRADTDPEVWLPALQEKMEAAGIAQSRVMYFPEGTYSSNLDEQLTAMGFQIAVIHCEEDRPLVLSAEESSIWHPGAMGFQGNAPKYWMREAVENRGNLIYTVGFERQDEIYDSGIFASMLSSFQSNTEQGVLGVMGAEEARVCHNQMQGDGGELEESYQAKKAGLEEKLETVKKEMEEIENAYK